MTTYPLVQMVTAPDSSAKVLFDCNDRLAWADGDDFTLGAPDLLGDPGGIGVQYGYRQPSWTLAVYGGEHEALAAHSRLAQQLTRHESWLHVRMTPSSPPMWLRCVRSAPGAASAARVYLDRPRNEWQIAVSLVADPFAVGREISHEVTVTNNPATGGLVYALPSIAGDAPTPLRVEVDPGDTLYVRPLVSTVATHEPYDGGAWSDRVVWQAEESTVLGDDTVVISDADASTGQAVEVQTGPTGWFRRISTPFRPPFAGRWRLYARIRRTSYGAEGNRFRIRGSGESCAEPVETQTSDDVGWELVDLGMFAFPRGNPPARRPYDLLTSGVGVDVARDNASTAVALRIDYVVAVPVDLPLDQVEPPRLLDFERHEETTGEETLVIDSAAIPQRVSVLRSGAFLYARPESPRGGFPLVVPGAANVLTLLTRRYGGTSQPRDRVTQSADLTLAYRPRWLYYASV